MSFRTLWFIKCSQCKFPKAYTYMYYIIYIYIHKIICIHRDTERCMYVYRGKKTLPFGTNQKQQISILSIWLPLNISGTAFASFGLTLASLRNAFGLHCGDLGCLGRLGGFHYKLNISLRANGADVTRRKHYQASRHSVTAVQAMVSLPQHRELLNGQVSG